MARPLENVRNIGIMAHIDAGKTTVTERVLYYAGRTHRMGEVDEGTTVTDWMAEEQRRGITITAAAITFDWGANMVNLIDTPGHVDFTAEVERCLRVLDGAVTVVCGVGGVEAQTETVWRQADKYGVPRVCFVNKLDRVGADFFRAVDSMRDRLGTRPLVLQIPIGAEREFRGMVDLIEMSALFFEEEAKGANILRGEIPGEMMDDCVRRREALIEAVAELSDPVMARYVEGEEVGVEELYAAIREITVQAAAAPVLCGSALRFKGIQPLLDAVGRYLPSPLDRPPVSGRDPKLEEPLERSASADEPFAALAFKVVSDRYDDLTYVRVYSGTLKARRRALNPRAGKRENMGRMYRMYANRREDPVDEIGPGDIVAVAGLSHTVTGDTLCDPAEPIVLERMDFPPTVIAMAIEPRTQADKGKLVEVLGRLAKEDPTFETRTDPETGQLVIAGMGELHLEVLKHRIREEYNLDANVGAPRVSYRETIARPVERAADFIQQTGGRGQYAKIRFRVDPAPALKGKVEFESCVRGGALAKEFIAAVGEGIIETAQGGVVTGYPLINIRVTLLDGNEHRVDSSVVAFRAAASLGLRSAVEEAGVVLLEPIMSLEIATPERYLGDVLNDLQSRRAEIVEVQDRSNLKFIRARAPLVEMFGYSTTLRSLTQGRGTHTMAPCDYRPAPEKVRSRVVV